MQHAPEHYHQQRIPVPAEFEQVISYFYAAHNGSSSQITRTLLPSFQTIMVFSFGPAISFQIGPSSLSVDQCMVLGPIKQPIEYTLPAGADLLVVNFKDDAFYRFFGPALISGPIAAHPDRLLQENCFSQLWLVLKEQSPSGRAGLILDFCRPYLKCRDAAFEDISRQTSDYLVTSPIKTLARKTGQSERNIQLNHKKYLGYTAKQRARYERFLKAMQLLQNPAGKVDWLEVVQACGYYDQSQLIHDFKHYLNLSPARYIKFQAQVCRVEQ